MLEPPGPLDPEALDRPDALFKPDTLFKQWDNSVHILAAVSGGPDSMALLHLLSCWQNARIQSKQKHGAHGPRVSAATVDHGLRSEAQEEANSVKEFALRLGIEHTTLKWEHERQDTRIQERARAARYELLCSHAKAIGADTIMTAHHADDQAETILFRLIRGSGLQGLAGMHSQRPLDGLWLARPLLAQRKDDLITYCRDRNVPFIDDPSNMSDQFARPRMRKILPTLEEEGLVPEGWQRLARRMQRANDALDHHARTAQARVTTGDEASGWTLDFHLLTAEPEEITLRIVTDLVKSLEQDKPIRLERAENLLRNLLQAEKSGKTHKATLGQAEISLNAKGILTVRRQSARKRGMPQHKPGQRDPKNTQKKESFVRSSSGISAQSEP